MDIIPVTRLQYQKDIVSKTSAAQPQKAAEEKAMEELERLLTSSQWIPFSEKSGRKSGWYLPHMGYAIEKAHKYPVNDLNAPKTSAFGGRIVLLPVAEMKKAICDGPIPTEFSVALKNSHAFQDNHYLSCATNAMEKRSWCYESKNEIPWNDPDCIVLPFFRMTSDEFIGKISSGEYILNGSTASKEPGFDEELDRLLRRLMRLLKWIPISTPSHQEGWYIPSAKLLVPKQVSFSRYSYGFESRAPRVFGLTPVLLSEAEIKQLLSSNRQRIPDGFSIAIKDSITGGSSSKNHYIACVHGQAFSFESGFYYSDGGNFNRIFIPFSRMEHTVFCEAIRDSEFQMSGNEDEIVEINKILSHRKDNSAANKEAQTVPKSTKSASPGVPATLSQNELEAYAKPLLECDTCRIGVDPYDRRILEDPNRGHWDLWLANAEKDKNIKTVSLPEGVTWYGRNPGLDVKDGLVGIDFGTKSTIVSYQDNTEQIKFHRIGTGSNKDGVKASDYENPTFMEFIDYDSFIRAYRASQGRPETSVDHLAVSHTAYNEFSTGQENQKFYSFFYDIKQWCGESSRAVRMKDQQGKDIELRPFMDCTEQDFNPLELYAYYLGLYINNMRNGIYLDYRLSFPVSFPEATKAKVLDSFSKGLKQSLPAAILQDSEYMDRFRVEQGISEPAAYAITALKEYGFQPKTASEKIAYAVFDFGGGTADFDFGIWRGPDPKKNRKERGKEYVIEHFGQASDSRLGGENLLELLAFRIFKANADTMREGGFTFQKPAGEADFPGAEVLISDSREARRNMKNLAELLRPFWEGILGLVETSTPAKNSKAPEGKPVTASSSSEEKEDNDDGEKKVIEYCGWQVKQSDIIASIANDGLIKVTLYDKDGSPHNDTTLYLSQKVTGITLDLISILKERISLGAKQFFEAFHRAKQTVPEYRNPDDRYIVFFAGNSSRSPLLLACMEEEKGNFLSQVAGDTTADFQFFPALGTEAAELRKKDRQVNQGLTDEWAPTGKTGVAYGLILGRPGGKILVTEVNPNNTARFKYHLGGTDHGNFRVHSKLVRDRIAEGTWVNFSIDIGESGENAEAPFYFTDFGSQDFEIYFSDLPAAATSADLPVGANGIYKLRCRIASPDEESDVWIRCTGSDTIEYCLSREENGPNKAEEAKAVSARLQASEK